MKKPVRCPVLQEPEAPQLTLHRDTGQGYVLIPLASGGKRRVYCGRFYESGDDGPVCRATLAQAESKINAARLGLGTCATAVRTVAELSAAFLEHECLQRGRSASKHARIALDFLSAKFGSLAATEFKGKHHAALESKFAAERREDGLSRWNARTVAKYLRTVRIAFQYADRIHDIPYRLKSSEGKQLENSTRERLRAPERVQPVADAAVDAVLPHVSRQVCALIELQRLTGMRPGEAIAITGAQIDRTEDPWIYRPTQHKTKHRGYVREIPLGPKAQALLTPWLESHLPSAPLFSPAEAEQERLTALHAARVTPDHLGNRPGSNRVEERRRGPGARYSVESYGQAIDRACKRAGIEPWAPNRIRHSVATELRKRFGIEAARVALGHRSSSVTEGYAELDRTAAARIAREIG